MHKGIQITEKMLLTGTNLTAVGELVSTPLGRKPSVEKVLLTEISVRRGGVYTTYCNFTAAFLIRIFSVSVLGSAGGGGGGK